MCTYTMNFHPPRYTLVVDVENHGNASVKGSIQFRISAQRLLFGKFPLRTRTFEGSYTPDFDFFPGSLCLLSGTLSSDIFIWYSFLFF